MCRVAISPPRPFDASRPTAGAKKTVCGGQTPRSFYCTFNTKNFKRFQMKLIHLLVFFQAALTLEIKDIPGFEKYTALEYSNGSGRVHGLSMVFIDATKNVWGFTLTHTCATCGKYGKEVYTGTFTRLFKSGFFQEGRAKATGTLHFRYFIGIVIELLDYNERLYFIPLPKDLADNAPYANRFHSLMYSSNSEDDDIGTVYLPPKPHFDTILSHSPSQNPKDLPIYLVKISIHMVFDSAFANHISQFFPGNRNKEILAIAKSHIEFLNNYFPSADIFKYEFHLARDPEILENCGEFCNDKGEYWHQEDSTFNPRKALTSVLSIFNNLVEKNPVPRHASIVSLFTMRHFLQVHGASSQIGMAGECKHGGKRTNCILVACGDADGFSTGMEQIQHAFLHEIAHQMGAMHDVGKQVNNDPKCLTRNFVMDSPSTGFLTFSECSIKALNVRLEGEMLP